VNGPSGLSGVVATQSVGQETDIEKELSTLLLQTEEYYAQDQAKLPRPAMMVLVQIVPGANGRLLDLVPLPVGLETELELQHKPHQAVLRPEPTRKSVKLVFLVQLPRRVRLQIRHLLPALQMPVQ